jgi:purine-binding chemotaxis protein CheW
MNLLDQQLPVQSGIGVLHPGEDDDIASICSLYADDRLYGIDTRRIREVLGRKTLERVPLAPSFIGGVLPYRGDVLTVVCFRALLGLAPAANPGCVLVLKSMDEQEPYGLMVDSVGGVVMLRQNTFTVNPSTLDEVGKALYSGAFRLDKGLLIQIDPERLRPSRLAETDLFRGAANHAPRGPRLHVESHGARSSKLQQEMQCER